MKAIKILLLGAAVSGALAYAALAYSKKPVEFYKGHTHVGVKTIGAPEHSGGTDRFGCHNASVPYHCH